MSGWQESGNWTSRLLTVGYSTGCDSAGIPDFRKCLFLISFLRDGRRCESSGAGHTTEAESGGTGVLHISGGAPDLRDAFEAGRR
jgi:hypothetical protein